MACANVDGDLPCCLLQQPLPTIPSQTSPAPPLAVIDSRGSTNLVITYENARPLEIDDRIEELLRDVRNHQRDAVPINETLRTQPQEFRTAVGGHIFAGSGDDARRRNPRAQALVPPRSGVPGHQREVGHNSDQILTNSIAVSSSFLPTR